MKIIFSILILLFSISIAYSKNTDIIHDFKITFDCKLEKIMIKNKDFNYQTFTADNIEVDKKKVLKVVAAQPSVLTINGLSEFIDTYSDISKDDVRIAKKDTILFKNIDIKKKYSESVFLNRSAVAGRPKDSEVSVRSTSLEAKPERVV